MCDNHYAEKKDPQWPARKGGGRGTCVRATRGSHIRRAYRTVERLKVTGPPSAFTPNRWEAGLGRVKEILSTKRAHSNPLRHGWCVSGKVLEICSLNLTAHTPSSCGRRQSSPGRHTFGSAVYFTTVGMQPRPGVGSTFNGLCCTVQGRCAASPTELRNDLSSLLCYWTVNSFTELVCTRF